jgi:hypothetical protein
MPSDDASQVSPRRPLKRFSATLAREVCRRTAAGQTQAEICADPAMPCAMTLNRWAKRHPRFARTYARVRALAEGEREDRRRSYCPALANEIAARVSQGESLAAIADDPAMPSLRTIFRWRDYEPAFADALGVARAAFAERLTDLGWGLAMDATPPMAHLTRVRLNYLRWMCAVQSPATHGRMKAVDPPAPPEALNITHRTFQVEVNRETGQIRSVAYHHDPEQGRLVRDLVGEWKDPPFPLVRKVDYLEAKAFRLAHGMNVDNPNAWDMRISAKDAPEA